MLIGIEVRAGLGRRVDIHNIVGTIRAALEAERDA